MQISPTTPPGITPDRSASTGPDGGAAAGPPAAAAGATPAPTLPPSAAPPGADRADIRALDLPALLLILQTEILDAVGLAPPGVGAVSSPQAAASIVDALLRSLPPEGADAPQWLAADDALQGAVLAGTARATALASARADTDPAVLAALPETHTLIAAAWGDETPAALMLLPEWLALAPRLQSLRRRRRLLRRRLLDPDAEAPSEDRTPLEGRTP
jgi:hypothetical protein